MKLYLKVTLELKLNNRCMVFSDTCDLKLNKRGMVFSNRLVILFTSETPDTGGETGSWADDSAAALSNLCNHSWWFWGTDEERGEDMNPVNHSGGFKRVERGPEGRAMEGITNKTQVLFT